ncbi:helix-turn-helix transcriptional regulator [Streptomyces sp. CBG31]|uniref:helix-turn-helix transcriptional regulator n=1 Tax=Streptomyces sp. CBG31 TaxID=2762623 RepID=UPI001C94F5E4|nr:helix-turn-helix transcriptional regulator [Streptomyces sp. CBG31]
MREQEEVTRVRVQWNCDGTNLLVSVRDDGPGRLNRELPAVRQLVARAASLGGLLDLEAIDNWGSRVEVRLPLDSSQSLEQLPGSWGLRPREIEVLRLLTAGQRNRQIAARMGISENTVKFHTSRDLPQARRHVPSRRGDRGRRGRPPVALGANTGRTGPPLGGTEAPYPCPYRSGELGLDPNRLQPRPVLLRICCRRPGEALIVLWQDRSPQEKHVTMLERPVRNHLFPVLLGPAAGTTSRPQGCGAPGRLAHEEAQVDAHPSAVSHLLTIGRTPPAWSR